MINYEQFYIGGQWVTPQSNQRLDVINPATESVAGSIALGNAADVELAIAAARGAFSSYSQTSREQRLELLGSIMSVYEKRMGEMAEAITSEIGAPLNFVSQQFQAPLLLGHLGVALEALKNFNYHEDAGTSRIQYEPIGVCGLITPWNWPAHQIGAKVAPALAAGCTMVLKPSELAPLSAHVFADILREAGVPEGVFNLVDGDGPTVGQILASHKEIDFISFTGSTRAGVEVSTAAAPTIKKVALELGGKSANILLEDADLEAAIPGGVMGMMINSGQNCNAPSRMIVPASRLAEVEAMAKGVAEGIAIGDPLAESTIMGPLANEAQFSKVQSLIQVGLDDGAKLVCGGVGKPDGLSEGYYVKPTIFSNVSNDMTIAREEIFGPVLCIIPYENEEQAVAIANDSEYGLAGYVSSASLDRAQAVASQLRAGSVHVNGADPDLAASFGGYKMSGLGREWGRHGFEEFLEVKSIFGYNPD